MTMQDLGNTTTVSSHDEQASEQSSNPSAKKSWFDIVYCSVWGFICAMARLFGGMLILYGIYYGIKSGYDRWFNMDGLVEVGECGYYYDSENDCFVKPCPHRRLMKGCLSLKYEIGDTIGIVQMRDEEYRYINLNTLSYINNKVYDCADVFRRGTAVALANDTIYYISPDGNTVSAEPSNWVYGSVEEITFMKEVSDRYSFTFDEPVSTGVLMYEDSNGYYGLMSSDFKKLTPALFTDITAKSKDVFFCEYIDSGLGVLIDRDGSVLK